MDVGVSDCRGEGVGETDAVIQGVLGVVGDEQGEGGGRSCGARNGLLVFRLRGSTAAPTPRVSTKGVAGADASRRAEGGRENSASESNAAPADVDVSVNVSADVNAHTRVHN